MKRTGVKLAVWRLFAGMSLVAGAKSRGAREGDGHGTRRKNLARKPIRPGPGTNVPGAVALSGVKCAPHKAPKECVSSVTPACG